MKKIVCSVLMYLFVSATVSYAERKPILIMGEIPTGPVKAPIPISIGQNSGQIQISFMTKIGLVDICVKNANGGIVYQAIVNTDITPNVVINTSSWSSGNYVITLTLGNGNKLNGVFTL